MSWPLGAAVLKCFIRSMSASDARPSLSSIHVFPTKPDKMLSQKALPANALYLLACPS